MLVVVFYCEIFLKEKTNMNNKLEASLSQNDLNSLFSTKVEKASNIYFYIMTKTHKIYIKNPQITWDQPYTEPDGAAIKYVDTTETVIAPTSTTRTELFFNGVASIENYPDLALFDSVILDSPIIEPFELLKNQQFSYNLDYHLWDFGTGEDIDLYNDTKSLSEEEWNRMFEQGIPTINTKNPIVFTADIEAIPRPVKETVEFVIPGTDRKLVIDVDSTRKNCLVDIFVSSLDEIVGDKNGIVTKIEYGTRKHTYRPLGLPVLTTEKNFVKVHLKPKNPADRKAIENLLDGKN